MPGYGHRGIGRWDAVVDALDREGHNGYMKLARDAYIFATISPVQAGQLQLGLQALTSPDPAQRIPKMNEMMIEISQGKQCGFRQAGACSGSGSPVYAVPSQRKQGRLF